MLIVDLPDADECSTLAAFCYDNDCYANGDDQSFFDCNHNVGGRRLLKVDNSSNSQLQHEALRAGGNISAIHSMQEQIDEEHKRNKTQRTESELQNEQIAGHNDDAKERPSNGG